MRTAVACLVLAAAIATPGVVVAAMSSDGHGTSVFGGTAARAVVPIQVTSQPAPVITPVLRRAALAVQRAFAARDVRLFLEPAGPRTVVLIQAPVSNGCTIFIVIQTPGAVPAPQERSCRTSGYGGGNGLSFSYSPASIRTTIDQALAGLPR
jgi:hypothetical protein